MTQADGAPVIVRSFPLIDPTTKGNRLMAEIIAKGVEIADAGNH